MNIYELEKEINDALEKYYNCFDDDGVLIANEEDFKKINDELFELQNKKNDFIEWLLKKRINIISNINGISNEIERLQNLKSSLEKKLNKTEKFIENLAIKNYDGKPVLYGNFKVSFRKSEQVIIENPDLIPNIYKKHIPESYVIDKTELKKFLKNGENISGAYLQEKLNLQIN